MDYWIKIKNIFGIVFGRFGVFSLLQFLYNFNFFWLIQNAYFLDNGISFKQLSVILGVWSLSIIVFEIPSGIIADKLGRKEIIVLGKVFMALALVLFFVFKSYLSFIVGAVLLGLHDSCLSGAFEALLYDSVKASGSENKYQDILSVTSVCREVGLGIGVVVSGVLRDIDLKYIAVGGIVIGLISIIVSLFLPRINTIEKSQDTRLLSFWGGALGVIKKSKLLINVVIILIFFGVSLTVIDEFFVVTFEEIGVKYLWIGILGLFESSFYILGSLISRKYKSARIKSWYLIIIIFSAISMFLIGQKTLVTLVIGWMLLRIFYAIFEMIVSVEWQKNIRSSDRATVTSIRDLILNLIYIPMAFGFGVLADEFGIFKSFVIMALLTILSILLIIFRFKPITQDTN